MIKNILTLLCILLATCVYSQVESTKKHKNRYKPTPIGEIIKDDLGSSLAISHDTLSVTTRSIVLKKDCQYKKEFFRLMTDCVKLKYTESFYNDIYSKGERCSTCIKCFPYFLNSIEKNRHKIFLLQRSIWSFVQRS